MAKLIPATERITRARALIKQAREYPLPVESGRNDLTYIAQVKAFLQQANDLIKFISKTPSATAEIKVEVEKVKQEIELADREIFHREIRPT